MIELTPEIEESSIVGQQVERAREGIKLDAGVVVSRLQQADPGFHADLGSRLNRWHPGIDDYQGLFYYHRHVCSMDRGTMAQWPEWKIVRGIKEVPLDYALRHEDFPVLDLSDLEAFETGGDCMATIESAQIDDIERIGWAEVFYRILKLNVPGITPTWLSREFSVPMDWYFQSKSSPIRATYDAAERRGYVA